QNKKTFLLLHALEVANQNQREELINLLQTDSSDKVERVTTIFKACNVDAWANELKEKYVQTAFKNLEEIAVTSVRKKYLQELASFLIKRDI
ncbi:MAG TPA: polyprenyl synthetase family protein, partial [Chitinophagaceae bacterium]|nr:polyprenyl synthetase family protein [Chitinophagaceae bacterium]